MCVLCNINEIRVKHWNARLMIHGMLLLNSPIQQFRFIHHHTHVHISYQKYMCVSMNMFENSKEENYFPQKYCRIWHDWRAHCTHTVERDRIMLRYHKGNVKIHKGAIFYTNLWWEQFYYWGRFNLMKNLLP